MPVRERALPCSPALRILYLYSGLKRRSDLADWLDRLLSEPSFAGIAKVEIEELDTLRDPLAHVWIATRVGRTFLTRCAQDSTRLRSLRTRVAPSRLGPLAPN